MTLSDKAQKFMDDKPTLLGQYAGFKFYEHPILGDESPLYVISQKVRLLKVIFGKCQTLWNTPKKN